MTALAEISMRPLSVSCFISVRVGLWLIMLRDFRFYQLTAYETDTNLLYYVMCFVDGLRDEVKSMVMIQRPCNLDEACALALVQEEAVKFGRKREYKRFDSSSSRGSQKSAFPLSSSSRVDRPDH
jgi:hypothetical protein